MTTPSEQGEPLGLVGLGGYAGGACRSILKSTAPRKFRLIAVHDLYADKFPEMVAKLQARGITLYKTYEEFLASPIKALWLPVPIDRHLPMTAQAIKAGKAVLCEKPAAGCIQDVEAMIQARDAGKMPVAIGYQHLYSSSTHQIKRQLLAGDLGKVTDATICTAWARESGYYARGWAGKLKQNGMWVLDSPANNAMAHYVHVAMFLLGAEPMTGARPVSVEAELYRVNPIENYDTCCIRVTVETGARLLICMTHATREYRPTTMVMHGDRGKFTYASDTMNGIWETGNDAVRRVALLRPGYLDVLGGFQKFLEDPTQPHASLEMSRMHALVISGASQCAPVVSVQPPFKQVEKRGTGTLTYIPGIADVFDEAVGKRQMVHETGVAPWSVAARRMDLRGFREFTGPAKE